MSNPVQACSFKIGGKSFQVFYDAREIYIPADYVGNPQRITMSAMWDGVNIVNDGSFVFVPVSWVYAEFPTFREENAKVLKKVNASVKVARAKTPQ